MKIEQPEIDKLIAYLDHKWGHDRACPMCGTTQWNIADRLFELMDFVPNTLAVGGPVLPVAAVTCMNCANTVFVNAIRAGLWEPQAATETPAGKTS